MDQGKIPNMFEVIVCDPDEGKFEGSAMGLLYTAVSRATPLGHNNGLGSAIYFTGQHLTEDRIRNLGKKANKNNEDYVKVTKRKSWVQHLKNNTRKSNITATNQEQLFQWGENTKISEKKLRERIQNYVQAKQ